MRGPGRRLSIGGLRHRMSIEEPVEAEDGSGGRTRSWAPYDTVWAALTPLSGGQEVTAGGRQMRLTHRLRLRYRGDLGAHMRFRLGARVFEIAALYDETEERRWLLCLCEEGEGA